MPVHILTGLLPWLLFNIILLFTGVSGSELTVYSSVGELVSLPCNLHGSLNCSSTTWIWNSGRSDETIELVQNGVVKANDQLIARRLRVGTNCSLHINDLTMADTGQYTCRLYQDTTNYADGSVKLSILNISAYSPVTDLTIGSTVTLVCKLHSPGSCGKSVRVIWVSETGDPLQGNRYKLSESGCSSNLTVTLEHSDRNMKWRCQLTEEGKVKASHNYTTSFPVVIRSEPTVYSSAGELVSHSSTTSFPGVSGSERTVYSSAGELVSLPCNHHGSLDCSSIVWLRSSVGSQETIESVTHGVVKDKNQKIARRLSVGNDCSLHINDLTTADAGRYSCRLYSNDKDYTDVVVFLSILNIFASSPVTELKTGIPVTLVCKLHSPEPCGKSVRVTWVSETGVPLQGNRHKLSDSECSSSLTVTLERSDHNMKWRCQLTVEGKLKASHSYTTIFPDSDKNKSDVWIGFGVAICVAVVLIVILIMICKRRTVQRKTAHNHVSQSHTVTDQNKGESEDTVTYAVVNPSAGGKRKQDQESAVLETEYAIIKTSQKSNKP